jgi:hypothetical protein
MSSSIGVLKSFRAWSCVVAIAALAIGVLGSILAGEASASGGFGAGPVGKSTAGKRSSANSGGGFGAGPVGKSTAGKRSSAKYNRFWFTFSRRDRHWAHRTSRCESGGNPRAIGGGGLYRGAFQFLKSSWKNSPQSPGGDPITYPYRTQAVVAVLLMKKVGTGPWPVCG